MQIKLKHPLSHGTLRVGQVNHERIPSLGGDVNPSVSYVQDYVNVYLVVCFVKSSFIYPYLDATRSGRILDYFDTLKVSLYTVGCTLQIQPLKCDKICKDSGMGMQRLLSSCKIHRNYSYVLLHDKYAMLSLK